MKKNILFISSNSPFDSIGGVERYLINLIEYYKNQTNINIFILIPSNGENSTKKIGSVTIYFDKSISLTGNINNTTQVEISKMAQLFSISVEEIIKSQKIDIICAENFHGLPPAYCIRINTLGLIYNIPLILQVHSFASTELEMELITQLMWNHVSCISKSVTADCFQKGADINFLSTHYLGVNTNEFNNKLTTDKLKKQLGLLNDSKIILTASRIMLKGKNILQKKGIIDLIQAFSKLSYRYPNLYLLIAVGKPPELQLQAFNESYEMLLGYIRLHKVSEKTILKMFKLEEMPQVYNESDIFVLPSENETFGQVFIESMACGLPVIGTKVGGIPEIISDSYNGYLVPPNDSSILAQRIEKLLADDPLRKRFINAGLKTVQSKFTSEKQFNSFYLMLENTTL